jgi:uncharacterized protein
MALWRLPWFLLGFVSLGCGLLGVVLPLVPTTPFLLLSAYGFSRSSPRVHRWLVGHPRLGPPIRDWHRHGAISGRAKAVAMAAIAATPLVSLALGAGRRWCSRSRSWSSPASPSSSSPGPRRRRTQSPLRRHHPPEGKVMAPGTLAQSEGPLHYWRGEGPLWRLYWIYGVLVSTAGGTLLLTATLYRLLSPWAILALVVVGLAYTVWILVSTWRCAFNIENPRVLGSRARGARLARPRADLRMGPQRDGRLAAAPPDRLRGRLRLRRARRRIAPPHPPAA